MFSIERRYSQSPARVFGAFADKEAVRRWRIDFECRKEHDFIYDFAVGGREVSRFTCPGGTEASFEAQFQDIVQDRRIVFAYRMAVGPAPFSASLATVEFSESDGGTLLKYTEQGAFFDAIGSAESREHGWSLLLESLDAELRR